MHPFVLALPLLFTSASSPVVSDTEELAQAFRGRDPAKIEAALKALAKSGRDGVDGLLAGARHDDAWVRVAAWRALGDLKGDGAAAVGPLCRHIATRSEDASQGAVGTLEMLSLVMMSPMAEMMARGKPFPVAKDETREDSERAERNIERLVCLSALMKLTKADPVAVFPHLAKTEVALGRDYSDVHVGFAVGVLFEKEKRIAVLEVGLQHEDPRVLAACLLASSGLEGEVGKIVPLVEKHVDSTEPGVRGLAWGALVALAPDGTTSREKAEKALSDESAFVRVHVARALAQRGGRGELALPVLLACMTDESPFVRSAAIHTFATDAVATLMSIGKKDEDQPFVFRPKDAVAPLVEALSDRDVGVQRRAASTLGDFGADAKSALPALQELVKHPDKDVRDSAARAIGRIEAAG